MTQLEVLILGAAPWISPRSRAVIRRLVAAGGRFAGADAFARSVDIPNRFQLTRLLSREGLPTLERLAAWVRLMGWSLEWEVRGRSLCDQALKPGRSPAGYYRTVEDLAGLTWRVVRSQCIDGVFLRFCAECRRIASA